VKYTRIPRDIANTIKWNRRILKECKRRFRNLVWRVVLEQHVRDLAAWIEGALR